MGFNGSFKTNKLTYMCKLGMANTVYTGVSYMLNSSLNIHFDQCIDHYNPQAKLACIFCYLFELKENCVSDCIKPYFKCLWHPKSLIWSSASHLMMLFLELQCV